MEGHDAAQPVFRPAALVIVFAGAAARKITFGPEANNIKIPEIFPYRLKILYQPAYSIGAALFAPCCLLFPRAARQGAGGRGLNAQREDLNFFNAGRLLIEHLTKTINTSPSSLQIELGGSYGAVKL